jgi:hypothetical protein
MDTEQFRRKLAGLEDPSRPLGASVDMAIKQDVIRFACMLAHLFGEGLARETLWGRIGSALATACAKVSDADTDRWATLCLEHVQADSVKTAACEPLGNLLAAWMGRPVEYRQAILNYTESRSYAVLAHARARWQDVKEGKADL